MLNKGYTYNEQGELVAIPMSAEEEADFLATQNIFTLEQYKQGIDEKVQALVDAECKKYRYDNISQVTQFAAVEGEFQGEAISLLDWNARVWELTEAHIANTTEIPTEDFINTLPIFE